jgi:hypothetical protein
MGAFFRHLTSGQTQKDGFGTFGTMGEVFKVEGAGQIPFARLEERLAIKAHGALERGATAFIVAQGLKGQLRVSSQKRRAHLLGKTRLRQICLGQIRGPDREGGHGKGKKGQKARRPQKPTYCGIRAGMAKSTHGLDLSKRTVGLGGLPGRDYLFVACL